MNIHRKKWFLPEEMGNRETNPVSVGLKAGLAMSNYLIHSVSIVPDDKTLPSVPPLQLSIPADYPDQSPQWDSDDQQYGKRVTIDW